MATAADNGPNRPHALLPRRAQHQLEKTELLDVMSAVDRRDRAAEAEAKTEHDQTREESRNKTLEQIQELRIDLHAQIDVRGVRVVALVASAGIAHWKRNVACLTHLPPSRAQELERDFENAHLNYLQNTEQRTQDFKHLTRSDQESHRVIKNNVRKIERLQRQRAQLIAKINQNKRECEERCVCGGL